MVAPALFKSPAEARISVFAVLILASSIIHSIWAILIECISPAMGLELFSFEGGCGLAAKVEAVPVKVRSCRGRFEQA